MSSWFFVRAASSRSLEEMSSDGVEVIESAEEADICEFSFSLSECRPV